MNGMTILRTDRLILRPWRVNDPSDARALYRHASDPEVGPRAGWPAHSSVEESARIIRDVLSADLTYAIVLRASESAIADADVSCGDGRVEHDGDRDGDDDAEGYGDGEGDGYGYGRPIGSIGLKEIAGKADARELGYWIGRPYWGRGLVPEAARELMRYGFDELGLTAVYACHDVSNGQSSRVMDKLGLVRLRTDRSVPRPLLGADIRRDEVVRRMTREEWTVRGTSGITPISRSSGGSGK